MAKRRFAAVAGERAKDCAHEHWQYAGETPCTGPMVCTMCGTRADSLPLAQMPAATLQRVYERTLLQQRANTDPVQTLPILERLCDSYREIERRGGLVADICPTCGEKPTDPDGVECKDCASETWNAEYRAFCD